MSDVKTKPTQVNVSDFIYSFTDNAQKQKDSFELIKIMQNLTGEPPVMWGPSIIGFGVYHFKSDKSKQEGDWPIIGFSPRKTAISLYVYTGCPEHEYLLENLGKFKMGKVCIYIKRLEDIDLKALTKLIKESIKHTKKKYG